MAQFSYDPYPVGKRDYLANPIKEQEFHAWTKDNHFRTSYGSMYTNKPREPANNAVPGYAGFIPGNKSRGEFGRSFATIAKDNLSKPELGQNTFGLSSTGFNLRQTALVDPSLTAYTHKYGAQTRLPNHPSLYGDTWTSHTHATYKDPNRSVQPTYRPASVDIVNKKPHTELSGYSTNGLKFDGKGLFPQDRDIERDVNGPTEYRIRYNTEKPYHMNTTMHVTRKVKPLSNTFNLPNNKY